MFSKTQNFSSVLTQDYQTNRKTFRQKNWAVLRFLVPCFTILSRNHLVCFPVRTYVQPLAGKQLARARHGGKAEWNITRCIQQFITQLRYNARSYWFKSMLYYTDKVMVFACLFCRMFCYIIKALEHNFL